MPKICIISDSHAAALRQGWRRIAPDFPDFEIRFFAAARNAMADLVVTDRQLVPGTAALRTQLKTTSGGMEQLTGPFDLYILCGLKLSNWPVLLMYRSMPDEEDKGIGNRFFLDEARTQLWKSLAIRTLTKLRACTAAPAILLATPFKPEDPAELYWQRLQRTGDGPRLAAVFNASCKSIARGLDATFLPQPPATLAPNQMNTRPEFLRTALANATVDDATHMGEVFGAIVLRDALSQHHIA